MSLEVQVVRTLFSIEHGGCPSPSPTPPDEEPMLYALRRAWQAVEARGAARSARRVPGGIAPAGEVGRAVGAFVLAAATHDVGAAGLGAGVGCAPGVARMVEVALARLILTALPPTRRGGSADAEGPATTIAIGTSAGSASAGAGSLGGAAAGPVSTSLPLTVRVGARGSAIVRANAAEHAARRVSDLPPPSWWGRERLGVGHTLLLTPPSRAGGRAEPRHDEVALWPAVPTARPALRLGEAPRRATRRAPGAERGLLGFAWRTLQDELEPGARRVGADGTAHPRAGGAW
jgi:hypothetical protein